MKENDDYSFSNNEIIERNSKLENSLIFNDIVKSVEEYFKCISCFKLIKNTIVCENCLKLFCNSCSDFFMSCPNCKICPFKQTKDKNVDYVIKKLFPNGNLLKENLNFSILIATDLNTLYKEKGIKNLIKEEKKDFNIFSSQLRQSMISNLSNMSFSSEFESIDEEYTYTNLFEIIENNGKLIKKEIEETKKNEPEKYIEINEALSNPPNSDLFISGLLAKHLNNEGVEVAIERHTSKSIKDSIMNLLTTGLYKGKIIQIHFDYSEQVNSKILENEMLRNTFIKSWLTIISSKTKIKKNNLYFKSLQGSISLSLVSMENIEQKQLEDIKKLYKEIKEIEYHLLLEGCVISPEMFDTRWNNRDGGWAKKGEKRGGRIYNPPYGWIGYGLNVTDKYDNKDNTWLGMKNIEGEWWVAYHGNGIKNNRIKDVNDTNHKNEIINNLPHFFNKVNNINELSKKKYPFVGSGLYLTDKINDDSFEIIEHLNHRYNITFMCRVHPNEVRISQEKENYFVVDPNENCVRPYRILLKEINYMKKDKCSLF